MLNIARSAIAAGPVLYMLHSAVGPPAHALERHVLVANDARMAIVEVYAANAGTGNYQLDILGDDFLHPGHSVMIDIDDGTDYCRYDFKTVFDDGTSVVRRNVDVCEASRYTISFR